MSQDKPVHEMRLGRVKAVIWRNETDLGVRYNIKFARLYKAGDQWQSTDSYGRDELVLLSKLADMAHTWVFQQNDRIEPAPDPFSDERNSRSSPRSESRMDRQANR
jgi:hypothetical protein